MPPCCQEGIHRQHGLRHQGLQDQRGRSVRFIPAGLNHNPYLNPEYAADLRAMPEAQRRAFLDGDWDSFAGAMFSELDRERHVVRPFALPSSWRRLAGVDWGYTAPWAVIWIAEDEDGRLWAYRELYVTQVRESDQAKRILAAEGDEQVTRYADDAMWATRGEARPISALYQEEGCHLLPADKGPGSRIAGWQRIHSYLAEARHVLITGQWAGPRARGCTLSPARIRLTVNAGHLISAADPAPS